MASKLSLDSRLTLFPIKDDEAWAVYKKMRAADWTAEELDMSEDFRDYIALKPAEQKLITNVLAFFAASDTIINANICCNFATEIPGLEIGCVYAMQQLIECVHSETYSLQIETLIQKKEQRQALFDSVRNSSTIRAKAAFAFKYMNIDIPLHVRLFAFTLAEGLHFQSSFATIAYFRTKNKLQGVTKANEFISRDEGMHCQFSAMLFKREQKKLAEHKQMTQELAEQIIKEAVSLEGKFVAEVLSEAILGLNAGTMMEFVKCVADRMLDLTGFKTLYNVQNPLSWMELSGLSNKTNFFEQRVSEYQRSGVGQTQEEIHEFSLDCEF